uniref:Uncharacterized protein n=1 Tax=Knipowitschia caucasica TaxID=637954 RepID=A0AAV2K357_KNICA
MNRAAPCALVQHLGQRRTLLCSRRVARGGGVVVREGPMSPGAEDGVDTRWARTDPPTEQRVGRVDCGSVPAGAAHARDTPRATSLSQKPTFPL